MELEMAFLRPLLESLMGFLLASLKSQLEPLMEFLKASLKG